MSVGYGGNDKCEVNLEGYEKPTFCFACGSDQIGPAIGPYGARLWQCGNCGHSGDRWYVECPDHECGNSFAHLHTPVRVDRNTEGMVIYAEGVAWCDACAHHALYQWRKEEWSSARLALVSWAGTGGSRIAFAQGDAVELEQTTS